MLRRMPFPFPDGRFPEELGAVVQTTVLEGLEPARLVIHFDDGSWAVGDGASIATHLRHVLEADPSLKRLASLKPGHCAERKERGEPWVTSVYDENG